MMTQEGAPTFPQRRRFRLPRRAGRAACVLLAASASAGHASGQSLPETHGDWVVQCANADTNGEQCQMTQTLTADGTGLHVMTMIVRPADGANGLTALIRLPHGLFLPSGVALQVNGGTAVPALIQTSDANGVYASVPLPASLVDAMKAGRSMTVAMQSVKREPIALTVSLAGFTAASGVLAARTTGD